MSRPRAHFLHLGKTGGTAIKDALEPHVAEGAYELVLHGHWVRLRNLPRRDAFFFAVRDPIDRYVSGFYSRRRRGLPRYDEPWTSEEAEAFGLFETANDLAEAIESPDRRLRRRARRAMRTIKHVRDPYGYWLGSTRRLRRSSTRVLQVLFQETLDEDFARLVGVLGLDADAARLPEDPVRAHRTPTDVDRSLSPRAVENLARWYRRDFELLEVCRALEPRRPGPAGSPAPDAARAAG